MEQHQTLAHEESRGQGIKGSSAQGVIADGSRLTGPRQWFSGTGVCYVNTRVDGVITLRFGEGRPVIQRFFTRLPLPGEELLPGE